MLALALSAALFPQVVTDTLVKDVRPKTLSGNPGSKAGRFGALGDGRLILSSTGDLVVTDGTPAGTAALRPIEGPLSVFGAPPVTLGDGRMLFSGRIDFEVGAEPFVTDGTNAGTQLVTNLKPVGSSDPSYFTKLGGVVYFVAAGDNGGVDIFRTDGTAAGTFRAVELGGAGLGVGIFSDVGLASAGGRLLILEQSASPESVRAWSSDGSQAGTVFLGEVGGEFAPSFGDIRFEPATSQGLVFQVFAGAASRIYGFNGQNLVELLPNVGALGWVREVGGAALFSVVTSGQAAIYRYDGGASTPTIVAEFGSLGTDALATAGGVAFAASPVGAGLTDRELWFSDGTAAGTGQVADVVPGPTGSVTASSIVEWNGEVYFTAVAPGLGRELYRISLPGGSPALVADLEPGPAGIGGALELDIVAAPNGVVFRRPDDEIGAEPWVTQGDLASTQFLIDANPGIPVGSEILSLTAAGEQVFFSALDGAVGRELWVSDGSETGTRRVQDFVPGSNSGLRAVDDAIAPLGTGPAVTQVVFEAGTLTSGFELWKSDGTTTELVIDLEPGTPSSEPQGLSPLGDRVLFFARQNSTTNLYATDGTAAGTVQCTAVGTPFGAFLFDILGNDGKRAYFMFRKPDGDEELFVTDGTPAGTGLLFEPPGAFDLTDVFSSAGGDGFFLFVANGGSTNGAGLYVTDGTTAGTQYLIGSAGTFFLNPTVVGSLGDRVLFTDGVELWITDGTPAGTLQVSPALSAFFGSEYTYVDAGSHGYIDFAVASFERRTVRTDGTSAGTVFVADYEAGDLEDQWLRGAVGTAGIGLLTRDDPTYGRELFRLDGQPGTGAPLTDSAPFGYDGNPGSVVRAGERLFFIADDSFTGPELHAIPFAAVETSLVESFGAGCSAGSQAAELGANGAPTIGASFNVALAQAAPASAAFLFYSAGFGSLFDPLSGCTIELPVPKFLGSFATDALGSGILALPLPANPALVGLRVGLQAAVAEPAGPLAGALGLSSALEVIVGP